MKWSSEQVRIKVFLSIPFFTGHPVDCNGNKNRQLTLKATVLDMVLVNVRIWRISPDVFSAPQNTISSAGLCNQNKRKKWYTVTGFEKGNKISNSSGGIRTHHLQVNNMPLLTKREVHTKKYLFGNSRHKSAESSEVYAPWRSEQMFPVWTEISVSKSLILYPPK